MLSCTDNEEGDTETFEVDLGGITWEAGKAYTYNITINPQGYVEQYLTFVALQSGTFSFSKAGLSYSLNGGETWTALSAGASTPTIAAGDSIMWKNRMTLTPSSSTGIGQFSSTGNFDAKGNIMSLYYGDNFSRQKDLSGKNYAFAALFRECSKLYNAENLVLPATTLSERCYYIMFYKCTNLTVAPKLPAKTLTNYCYMQMFLNCTNLTAAPELPAIRLNYESYHNMFGECKNLRYVKAAFTTVPGNNYTRNWLENVSSTGTFYKNAAATWTTTGTSAVPSGWTVVRYTP